MWGLSSRSSDGLFIIFPPVSINFIWPNKTNRLWFKKSKSTKLKYSVLHVQYLNELKNKIPNRVSGQLYDCLSVMYGEVCGRWGSYVNIVSFPNISTLQNILYKIWLAPVTGYIWNLISAFFCENPAILSCNSHPPHNSREPPVVMAGSLPRMSHTHFFLLTLIL